MKSRVYVSSLAAIAVVSQAALAQHAGTVTSFRKDLDVVQQAEPYSVKESQVLSALIKGNSAAITQLISPNSLRKVGMQNFQRKLERELIPYFSDFQKPVHNMTETPASLNGVNVGYNFYDSFLSQSGQKKPYLISIIKENGQLYCAGIVPNISYAQYHAGHRQALSPSTRNIATTNPANSSISSSSNRISVVALVRPAKSLFDHGQYAAAALAYERALSKAGRVLPADDSISFLLRDDLAVTYGKLGRLADAEQLQRQCLEYYKQHNGPESKEAARADSALQRTLSLEHKIPQHQ